MKKRNAPKKPDETPAKPTVEVRRPEMLRWMLMLALLALTALCGVIAVASIGRSTLTVAVMGLLAVAMLWYARALLLTDASAVIFDGETVSDDSGEVLCSIEEIASVERGLALFRPSSGFVITLKAEKPRAGSPALWWRFRKTVGVGGATPVKAGRNMADAIAQVLAMRASG